MYFYSFCSTWKIYEDNHIVLHVTYKNVLSLIVDCTEDEPSTVFLGRFAFSRSKWVTIQAVSTISIVELVNSLRFISRSARNTWNLCDGDFSVARQQNRKCAPSLNAHIAIFGNWSPQNSIHWKCTPWLCSICAPQF